jgi:hypothetical protein
MVLARYSRTLSCGIDIGGGGGILAGVSLGSGEMVGHGSVEGCEEGPDVVGFGLAPPGRRRGGGAAMERWVREVRRASREGGQGRVVRFEVNQCARKVKGRLGVEEGGEGIVED